jgi:hypothetical protein
MEKIDVNGFFVNFKIKWYMLNNFLLHQLYQMLNDQ